MQMTIFAMLSLFFNLLFLQSKSALVNPTAVLLLKWDHGSLNFGQFLVPICHVLHLCWRRPIPMWSSLSLCNFAFHHINIYCSLYSIPFTISTRKLTNANYLQIVVVILTTTSVNCFLCAVRKLKTKCPFCSLVRILQNSWYSLCSFCLVGAQIRSSQYPLKIPSWAPWGGLTGAEETQ